METLPLRMQKHCENAVDVAKFLDKHEKVAWVRFAGIGGPNHNLHLKYCPKGAGALFTFGLKGGYEAGKKLADSVKMISQLTEEQRKAAGAETETLRISIGLEDSKDI